MIVDFTTTATCRPEILEKTYTSFLTKLTGFDPTESTLYINIDPVPKDVPPLKVIEAASRHFRKVVSNVPPHPSFPSAVKWCWNQPRSKYFFHLEDDWTLDVIVDINNLIKIFESNKIPNLACVNLRAYPTIKDNRICLSPGLWKTEAAKVIASRLTIDANPEKQLRVNDATNHDGGRHSGYAGMQYSGHPIITDIGRIWLMGKKYHKNKGMFFTAWEERHQDDRHPHVQPTIKMVGKRTIKNTAPPVVRPRSKTLPTVKRNPIQKTQKSLTPLFGRIRVKPATQR